MRISIIVAALAVVASARSISRRQDPGEGAPPCAMECVKKAQSGSKCGQTDVACFCRDKTVTDSVGTCVQDSCPPDEAIAALKFACDLCANAGAPLPEQDCKAAQP